ncbi:MAG TPA: GGDEF domain-containing protein [Veillonellaceae bacterium]|uniref:sensor domain-containing diguanylate cyclase n=1 Tax=Dialister hominis TaxID=2582419 RepID=UPI00265CD6E6|nr:GGDEF domain-containing protein [uncultured Dialister sp.]HJI43411.1 GGDEF domain-containing protein [Veillonellaceae bacterium]
MYRNTYTLQDIAELSGCIKAFQEAHPTPAPYLSISIFTHWNDPALIQAMTDGLSKAFPRAAIAGLTTAGGIEDGQMNTGKTILSFMAFDESPVEVLHYNMKDLRAVEILETQLTGNVEPFLDAISALPPSVAIFGGGADTDDLNQPSYVFDKEAIMNEGFVIMLFRGTVKVLTRSVLGWQPLGRQVTITAMDGNMVIKELDHIAVNFYEKYLKIDPSVGFDKKTLSFSLVVEKDGVELARLPMSCRKDGSLVFNIALHVGDKLRMAYGDPNEIINGSRRVLGRIRDFGPQGMLLFSCVVRRYYLKDDVNQILSAYERITPAAGGYTRGEIDRIEGHVYTMNMNLVSAAFREETKDHKRTIADITGDPSHMENDPALNLDDSLSTVQRLASFITVTSKELSDAYQKLAFVAGHDSLTDLLNRGRIEWVLRHLIEDTNKTHHTFSAIMIDIDSFKHINDTYGHSVGDDVLIRLADIMKSGVRPTDYAGRWGGDEFVILLPDTDIDQSEKVADRMRKNFAEADILPDGKAVTASFGVTTSYEGETLESFYRRMDSALYTAKGAGKNQVILLRSEKSANN